MTPAIPTATQIDKLAIYKGATWEHVLTFTDSAGDSLDLTGLSPFVFTITKLKSDTLIVNATVANTNLAGGIITISLTAAQTEALNIGDVRAGLRDNINDPYLQMILAVKYFSPDPV